MATIKDVAKLAGVSIATVSRYVNQSSVLTEESKRKVEAAIKELHYIPNTAAKNLKNQSSSTIALIIPEMSNPFYTNIYIAFRRYALESGYHTALFSVEEDEQSFIALEKQILSGYYSGVVIALLDNPVFMTYVERFVAALPTVLISSLNLSSMCSCVMIDTFDAEYRATKHLIDMGRKKVAFINGNLSRQASRDKQEGYKKCLTDAGRAIDEALMYSGHYSSADGYTAARQFMMSGNAPDAIVCANDILAIGCLKYLVHTGFKVPEDVAVIGMDGTSLAYNFIPSITTMEIPLDAMCKSAMEMLQIKMGHQRGANQMSIFQAALVENNSTNKEAPLRFDI